MGWSPPCFSICSISLMTSSSFWTSSLVNSLGSVTGGSWGSVAIYEKKAGGVAPARRIAGLERSVQADAALIAGEALGERERGHRAFGQVHAGADRVRDGARDELLGGVERVAAEELLARGEHGLHFVEGGGERRGDGAE